MDGALGTLLRGYRRAAGLTQEALAGKARLSVQAVGALERGDRRFPHRDTVARLAEALGLAEDQRVRLAAVASRKGTPRKPAEDLAGGARVPHQLPPDVSAFTGRTEERALLDQLTTSEASSAVVISAIAGTAGVGKTALAVHWAHQIRDRFPDGQLYLNLRGYDPDQPMPPGAALARLLTGLGVAEHDVPLDPDDRAARYRTETSARRLLIVLDNARSTEQIRPLLPGTPTCLVLITSRDSLAGLVAVDGARRLDLDLLPLPDAVTLLRRLFGARADAQPDVVATLAEQCARLPLALRIAAELANTHRSTPLADLSTELTDRQRRLDLLDAGGDQHAAVRAVFSWSVHHLDTDTARTFRYLGLHPGPDLDPYAAAALTDGSVEQARAHLSTLTRAHLTHAAGFGRYGIHDLLRAYAIELTSATDSPQDRHAAVTRLLDHYAHAVTVATGLLYPSETGNRPGSRPPVNRTPVFDDQTQAAVWLDTELPNLLAAGHGWPTHTIALATTLHRHLRTRGRYADAHPLHTHALNLARHTGDRNDEYDALCCLGDIYYLQGQYGPATDCFRQGLTIARDTGNRAGELAALQGLGENCYIQGQYRSAADCFQQALTIADDTSNHNGELHALRGLGNIHTMQARYGPATDCFEQALTIARDTGNRAGELRALRGLGDVHRLQGRYGPATDCFQRALTIARDSDDRTSEVNALRGLGNVHRLQGRYGPATDCFQQALTIARDTGNRAGELNTLVLLGSVHRRQGHYGPATDCYEQALTIAHDTSNRNGQFEALHGLAHTRHATGHTDQALTYHRQALDLADALGQPDDQARAHDGLARAHHALGHPAGASHHWQQALDLLATIGLTEVEDVRADDIRSHLAAIDRKTRPL